MTTRRQWFAQGAASWHAAQIELGVPAQEARRELYVCPLCIELKAKEAQVRCRAFVEGALDDNSLTVEHVPLQSFGGRPLLLTCWDCNNTAGTELDPHARKRENPRDAFLGRATTKVSMAVGGHKLVGSFGMDEKGHDRFEVTKKKHAHKPDAEAGFRRMLEDMNGPNRDIGISFDHDRFDEDRARASWLRAAYLTTFAVTGYRTILRPEMEIVRRQIREPKVPHIPTFVIDTRGKEDWSDRTFIRVTEPSWQRCWGIKVGHYVVCVPLPGDVDLYNRLDAAKRAGTGKMVFNANQREWPTAPSFGLLPVATDVGRVPNLRHPASAKSGKTMQQKASRGKPQVVDGSGDTQHGARRNT